MHKRWFLGLPLVVAATGIMGVPVMAAGSGYGPIPPVSSTVPGGYTTVVTTRTLSPSAAAQTVSVSVTHSPTQLVVPSGAFTYPVQIVVTTPNLTSLSASLSSVHLAGYSAIAGIGIGVDTSGGQPVTSTFRHPLTVTVHNAAIKAGDKVVEWNQQGTLSPVAASVANGVATWSFSSDPAFAILSPVQTVPQATSPVTGKPFLRMGMLGIVAMGIGALLIRRSGRRSA